MKCEYEGAVIFWMKKGAQGNRLSVFATVVDLLARLLGLRGLVAYTTVFTTATHDLYRWAYDYKSTDPDLLDLDSIEEWIHHSDQETWRDNYQEIADDMRKLIQENRYLRQQ